MWPEYQMVRGVAAIGYIPVACWLVGLSCFALMPTRLWFFWIFVFTSVLHLCFAIIHLALVFHIPCAAPSWPWFPYFYNGYLAGLFVTSCLNAVGFTALVIWLCKRSKLLSAPSV